MLRTVTTRDGIPQAGRKYGNIYVAVTLSDPMIAFSNASGVSAVNSVLDCEMWMAHAQKPDFVFRRNGRVHLNRRGRQFS
jgi:hypothetical protein